MENKKINRLSIPLPVEKKLDELYRLIEEHPLSIPLPRLAEFLGADAPGLRNSIDKGQCPFGLGWQKSIRGYKAYKIPTVPFYLWYTQGVGFRD